ncbi:MAG: GNAT family N-acetyltransferase [Planktotalea sp.]|uniref:GNAT family N-acetyltransferase n=1 Tax=Planktotalea sp. TaxID=2029877 RepID=UPI003C721BCC
MTDFTIRPARAHDAIAIAEMVSGLAEHHSDVAQMSAEDVVFLCFGPAPWLTLIVAETGDKLLGYAALQRKVQLQFARRLMEVHHLFVTSDARGRGIGSALIDASCQHAWSIGCKGVTLGVMEHNSAAQAFYRAHWFSIAEPNGSVQMLRRFDLPLGQGAQ